MLVVPELCGELRVMLHNRWLQQELKQMRQQREAFEDQIQRLDWSLRNLALSPRQRHEYDSYLEVLQARGTRLLANGWLGCTLLGPTSCSRRTLSSGSWPWMPPSIP